MNFITDYKWTFPVNIPKQGSKVPHNWHVTFYVPSLPNNDAVVNVNNICLSIDFR